MNEPDPTANLDAAERQHLLHRIAKLDRARRRWKVLALASSPLLAVLLLLAGANAVTSLLALRDVARRERQAREDAQRQAEVALAEAQELMAVAHRGVHEVEAAKQAMEEDVPQGKPIALFLEVVEPEVKAGVAPRFRLMLKNTSEVAQKVLDIRERHDLQHTYYDLNVTKDGKPVSLPRAISDPGPVSEKDFLSLPPGGSVAFVLSSFPVSFKDLRPGDYQASVRFWQHPHESHKTAYDSPEVTFTVPK
jgi:hypothetical protein